jgi:hypothetical protein
MEIIVEHFAYNPLEDENAFSRLVHPGLKFLLL